LRILVTEAEERSVLSACRGLKKAGYDVSAAASRSGAEGQWSRSCSERIRLPDPQQNGASFVDSLEKRLREKKYSVLIPGTEASLLAVSENRRRLERLTRIGLPSHRAVLRSLDKVAVLGEAMAAGLHPPPSAICANPNEAKDACNELGFPVVVKAARSFTPGAGETKRTVVVVSDEVALVKEASRLGTPVTVQRFETGMPLFSCSGVFADGHMLALTSARVLRTWPPLAGSFSFMETVSSSPSLVARISALLSAIQWQGIFQIDFLDRGKERFSFLDLNPRVFASLALDIESGANLPGVWCDWLLGRDVEVVSARPGVRYRWEEGELRYCLYELRRRRLRAAGAVIRPRRRVIHGHFQIGDPAPTVAWLFGVWRRSLRRLARGR